MTDEEISKLESLCERYATGPADGSQADMRHEFAEALPAALAEIRRLREVVQGAERSGDSFPSGGCPACPWCGATASVSRKEPHADSCPAFLPDGRVR